MSHGVTYMTPKDKNVLIFNLIPQKIIFHCVSSESAILRFKIEIHLTFAVTSVQLAWVGVLSAQINVLFSINKSVLCKRN